MSERLVFHDQCNDADTCNCFFADVREGGHSCCFVFHGE